MLVLKRKQNEEIILQLDDKQVEIMIANITHRTVTLSFKADDKIKIYRKEVYLKIKKESESE